MMEFIIPAVIRLLHNLFTVFWIGGMLTLALIITPVIKNSKMGLKEKKALLGVIKKRLSILVYISMFGLIITGFMMSLRSGLYTGPLSFSNDYTNLLTLKHLLVILMIAVAIFRSYVVERWQSLQPNTKQKLNMVLLLANIILGVTVLFLSALTTVIASST